MIIQVSKILLLVSVLNKKHHSTLKKSKTHSKDAKLADDGVPKARDLGDHFGVSQEYNAYGLPDRLRIDKL